MVPGAKRRGIVTAILGSCAAVLVAGVAVASPHVVDRWNIYASTTGGPREAYPVFLGPFPTAFSCTVEARLIVRGGGHAFCKSQHVVELGTRQQDLLMAEFWPSSRWIALCQARLRGRPAGAPSRLSSLSVPPVR